MIPCILPAWLTYLTEKLWGLNSWTVLWSDKYSLLRLSIVAPEIPYIPYIHIVAAWSNNHLSSLSRFLCILAAARPHETSETLFPQLHHNICTDPSEYHERSIEVAAFASVTLMNGRHRQLSSYSTSSLNHMAHKIPPHSSPWGYNYHSKMDLKSPTWRWSPCKLVGEKAEIHLGMILWYIDILS